MNEVVAQTFASILAGLSVRLRERGFRKRGAHFRLRDSADGRVAVVTLQRSASNSRRATYMTYYVNVGVVVPTLLRMSFPDANLDALRAEDGFWDDRLARPERTFGDWSVDASTNAEVEVAQICTLVDAWLAARDRLLDDAALLDGLLAGRVRKGSGFYSAKCAVALAVALGDAGRLQAAREKLESHACEVPGFSVDVFVRSFDSRENRDA